ncbi:MAG: VOC family protein [Jatrophihabitans sp.]
MSENPADHLPRPDASAAVEHLGWRLLLGAYQASVPVASSESGLAVAQAVVAACGADADTHLRVDLRPRRVELALQAAGSERVTRRDVELAEAVAQAVTDAGFTIGAPTGDRPAQILEIAIDALDIPAIRPFWAAVLDYVDEPMTADVGAAAIVDPVGQGPAVWFQQLDEPRRQRNRIHFDITVAHDEADRRIRAALDAGGVLVSDAAARAFWILADVEGNEICVCTWQDRDSRIERG